MTALYCEAELIGPLRINQLAMWKKSPSGHLASLSNTDGLVCG